MYRFFVKFNIHPPSRVKSKRIVHYIVFFPQKSPTYFEISELVDDWFSGQVVDVLDIVESLVGGTAFVHLLLVLGLDGIHSLENA